MGNNQNTGQTNKFKNVNFKKLNTSERNVAKSPTPNIAKSNTHLKFPSSTLTINKSPNPLLKNTSSFKKSSKNLNSGNSNNNINNNNNNNNQYSFEQQNILTLANIKTLNPTNNYNFKDSKLQNLLDILSKHYLFKYIDEDYIKSKILSKLIKISLKPETTIYQKSFDDAEYFYILIKGTCQYSNIKNIINYHETNDKITEGTCFGEYEIINDIPRICEVHTETDCLIYALHKEELFEALKYSRKKNLTHIENFFNINYPFMNNYPEIKKYLINECIVIYNYDTNKTLISKCFDEMINSNIFIIVQGKVSTYHKNEIAKTLRKGDIIGHRELILNESFERNIFLVTDSDDVELYGISYNKLINYFQEHLCIKNVTFFAFLLSFHKSYYCNSIDINNLWKLFNCCELHSYKTNELIYKKGLNLNEEVICIIEGNIVNSNKTTYEAVRNDILYEKELLYNHNSILIMNDLTAFPECLILHANSEKIKEAFNGKEISEIVISSDKKAKCHNLMVDLLKHVGIPLNKVKIKEIEKAITIEKYERKIPIITQGSKDLSKYYIIKSGYVDFYVNNKYMRTLAENSPFGFRANFIKSPVRTASAVANCQCEIYAIDAKIFDKYVLKELSAFNNYLKYKINLEDDTVELDDLENIRLLGKGSFGFVNLVKSKKNKSLYAIKAIPLNKIIQYDLYEGIINERNTLKILDHPFLMKQVKSLKNKEFVFFLNEYIRGKVLSKILKEENNLNKNRVQLYSASLLKVVEYLHLNNFIHRDIKPENIILNENGYIKLIDFGTVKDTINYGSTTHTLIGTPHYMAPEVVRGDSYDYKVDYWSIACCMYEFACGKTPFGSDLKDPTEIYKAVQNEKLTFSNNIKDKDFINLVSLMLERDIEKRLYGVKAQNHNWFKEYDWKSLVDMNIQIPYKPVIVDVEDNLRSTSNKDYLSELKKIVANNPKKTKDSNYEPNENDKKRCNDWLNDF